MKNLTIEITDKCPLFCQHCSTYGAWDRDDIIISLENFIRILEQNPSYKEIRLSGGEPFMHPEIIKFIQEAKKRDHIVRILSCGVYRNGNNYQAIPKKIINTCKELIDNISLSLYGSKEIHEKVVGLPDTFQYLDETVNRAIFAEIPFSFGFVPLTINKHDLENTVRYASKKTKQQNYCMPELHLLRYVKQGGCQYDIPEIKEKLALTSEENQQIIEQAKHLEQEYKIPITFSCSMLERNCGAGKEKKVITIYGNKCDCSALKWNLEKTLEGEVFCKLKH